MKWTVQIKRIEIIEVVVEADTEALAEEAGEAAVDRGEGEVVNNEEYVNNCEQMKE